MMSSLYVAQTWETSLFFLVKTTSYRLHVRDAKDIKYCPVDADAGELYFLHELLDVKHGDLTIGLNQDEIDEIIEDICTS